MKTVTPDGILTLDAPELRRRSAIIVNRLRQCIEVCKRVLLEKFQDTQCDAAGKLSQSIYVVESLLGKCHQEGDLLFFTIRQDPQVKLNIPSFFLDGIKSKHNAVWPEMPSTAEQKAYRQFYRNLGEGILGSECPSLGARLL